MTITYQAFYGSVFATVLWALWHLSKVGQRPKDYPPGPPTLPVIGNLHQMTQKQGHLQFQKWAQEYGPVYSLMLGTKIYVVLSSDKAIKDLLDKRSAIYSSRPEVYLGQETLSGGLRVLFMVSSCHSLLLVCLEEADGLRLLTMSANPSQKGL